MNTQIISHGFLTLPLEVLIDCLIPFSPCYKNEEKKISSVSPGLRPSARGCGEERGEYVCVCLVPPSRLLLRGFWLPSCLFPSHRSQKRGAFLLPFLGEILPGTERKHHQTEAWMAGGWHIAPIKMPPVAPDLGEGKPSLQSEGNRNSILYGLIKTTSPSWRVSE